MNETNKIHLGDCFDVMKTLPDHSFDAIITDPPYNMTKCDWDVKIDLDRVFSEWIRLIKSDGIIVIFGAQPFVTDLINAGRKYYRYDLIWEKSKGVGFLDANIKPLRTHEYILIFGKHKGAYNPQKSKGKPYITKVNNNNNKCTIYNEKRLPKINETGERYPNSILKFGVDTDTYKHPTKKPQALLEYLIRTYTNENDIILDPFAGSGTTAAAAIMTDRNFTIIEKDENYYKICIKRCNEAQTKRNSQLF